MKNLLYIISLVIILCNPAYTANDDKSIVSPTDPTDPADVFKTRKGTYTTINNERITPKDSGNASKTNTAGNNVQLGTYSANATFASGSIVAGALSIKDKNFVIPGICMVDGKNLTVNYEDVVSVTILSWKSKQTDKADSYIFYPEKAKVILNDGSEYVTTNTVPFYSFKMEANKRTFTVYSYFYCDKKNGKWYFGKEQVSNPSYTPHEKTLCAISFKKDNTGVNFDPGDFLKFLIK